MGSGMSVWVQIRKEGYVAFELTLASAHTAVGK